VRWGCTITNVYIETSSEGHSPSSPSLNTKSKLQTCGYKTAGGGGVEGSECDNIAFFLPFPHHSNNLCLLQHPSSHSAPAPILLPTPSSSPLFPMTHVLYCGLCLMLPCHILCLCLFVSLPARCWTYSYSVDPPLPCTLHYFLFASTPTPLHSHSLHFTTRV